MQQEWGQMRAHEALTVVGQWKLERAKAREEMTLAYEYE